LSQFYRGVLGGEVNRPDPRWATSETFMTLHVDDGSVLAFQRVEEFQPPRGPASEFPQQLHLDVDVPDLEKAEQEVLALGAMLLQADARGWRIFADPAGHPFCLL
jgi:hypothetical protein